MMLARPTSARLHLQPKKPPYPRVLEVLLSSLNPARVVEPAKTLTIMGFIAKREIGPAGTFSGEATASLSHFLNTAWLCCRWTAQCEVLHTHAHTRLTVTSHRTHFDARPHAGNIAKVQRSDPAALRN